MYKSLVILGLFLFPSVANAQVVLYRPYGYGYGYGYRNYGYYNYSQPAFYNNYYYTAPQRPYVPPLSPTQLYERKTKNLDAKLTYEQHAIDAAIKVRENAISNGQRFAELRDKEAYARAKGYLPPIPTPRFVYKNVDYGTFDNFKRYPAFNDYLAEIEANHHDDSNDKREQALNLHYRFYEYKNMDSLQKDRRQVRNSVIDSLKADIVLGRKSVEETKRMLELLDTLQR